MPTWSQIVGLVQHISQEAREHELIISTHHSVTAQVRTWECSCHSEITKNTYIRISLVLRCLLQLVDIVMQRVKTRTLLFELDYF